MKIDLTHLSFLFADNDVRCHPYAQPLNSSFTDIDLLLFTLQIASAMEHLSQRNVRITNNNVYVMCVCVCGHE